MREIDERTLSLARRIGASLPPPTEPAPVERVDLTAAAARLERLYQGPFTLMKVRSRDYEARTLGGDVGRGDSAGAAVVALCHALTS